MDDEGLTSDPEFAAARCHSDKASAGSRYIDTSAASLSAALNSFLDILAEIALEDALEQNREVEEQ
jgi:DNA-binding IscR family transcriptional regulator